MGKEKFPIKGKSASKWLAYNMAMRARVFDDWTESMIRQNPDALVLHIGCGLDSRCEIIQVHPKQWIDCDFPDVIAARRKYYNESTWYSMSDFNLTDTEQIDKLTESKTAIIVLEGISMYLTNEELRTSLKSLQDKYERVHILMDIYTVFGAKTSKYKNPINDVGVTLVYGIDDIASLLQGMKLHLVKEHSFTPNYLVNELKGFDKFFFKLLFTGKSYSRICRLLELES